MWDVLLAPSNSTSARLFAGEHLSDVLPEHFSGVNRVVTSREQSGIGSGTSPLGGTAASKVGTSSGGRTAGNKDAKKKGK